MKGARILVVNHNLSLAGAPLIIFDYARHFALQGNEVVTLSPEQGALSERYLDSNIPVKILKDVLPRANENAIEFRSRLQQISREIDITSFDLVVCNTLLSFWAVEMAILSHKPVVWHIHESATIRDFLPLTSSVEKMTVEAFKGADRVVFQANATRRLFAKLDTGSNFTCIPGGVDVGRIEQFRTKHDKTELRKKHNLPLDETIISVIGTTCERKGQHIFLLAIKELEKVYRGERLTFLMVGGRPSAYLDMLSSQIERHGIKNARIIAETDDVYDYFAASDIFVCSSLEESFPRVILEAMAFRLPIVSTRVFGVPEMLADGWDAHLVESGSAKSLAAGILRHVEEPEKARTMAGYAWAKVNRQFNNATLLPVHMELARGVMAGAGQNSSQAAKGKLSSARRYGRGSADTNGPDKIFEAG